MTAFRWLRQIDGWLKSVHAKTHWFTDHEAWAIFRLGAILESIGWTWLIIAIIYKHAHGPGYAINIALAGRFHGMFFLIYFIFALLVSRSLGWGKGWTLTALALGNPPYGSLIFEQYMERRRKTHPNRLPDPPGID